MSTVRPFAGLRPPKDLVTSLACPPYDVINTAEARALAAGNPRSFLHVSRPEIDLAPGVDEHSEPVYARGAENLEAFKRSGWLVPDPGPRFYLYRQREGGHSQLGLVACASVDEYQDGRIKKHELTRVDKEEDRTRHIDRLGAHDEPVFLTYRARPGIDALANRLAAQPPAYDFTVGETSHTLWVVDGAADLATFEREFAAIPLLYIADGHHRSAAALRVRERRARLPGHTGREEYNAFLAVIYPHDQMRILDYNRLVFDLNGLGAEAFVRRLDAAFTCRPADQKKPTRAGDFGMYLGGRWHLLTAKPGTFDAADPVASLDVSVLQANLLAPVLGIQDPRTDKRIDFVGGARGTAELERRVDSGEAKVAFSMFPTSIDQLLRVADAGKIMPPKSTWFEPKPRSGLVVHGF